MIFSTYTFKNKTCKPGENTRGITLNITTIEYFKYGFEMPTEAGQSFHNLGLNWLQYKTEALPSNTPHGHFIPWAFVKPGFGIYPDLASMSLQSPVFVVGSIEPTLKRLPTFRFPPALIPLYFLRPFNYHFEHNIFESYFAFFVSLGAHKWPQLWEIKSEWGKGSLLQRNTCSDCRLGSSRKRQAFQEHINFETSWRSGQPCRLERLFYPVNITASVNTNILTSWLSWLELFKRKNWQSKNLVRPSQYGED